MGGKAFYESKKGGKSNSSVASETGHCSERACMHSWLLIDKTAFVSLIIAISFKICITLANYAANFRSKKSNICIHCITLINPQVNEINYFRFDGHLQAYESLFLKTFPH